MLRPATPLTILLLAAFVLLVISIISTPIIKSIPLASFGGVDFGVFGFCKGTDCSNVEIGYDTTKLFTDDQASTFDLPVHTRTTLSAILIVHPIAALFTLVMLCLAASAHLHSPSHSPRFLLGIFILSILTLVLTLLAFLIDVLLFVPHMAWGSYIVLAATILIAASGIVSCAMRRTLVSRKARKRRIAENAEMNGENFYARQGGEPVAPTVSNTMVNSSQPDKMPEFATFEMAKKTPERTSDERMPLTTRTPTDNSPTNGQGMNGYAGPDRMNSLPRDQYGNPIPRGPPGPYGARSRDPSQDPLQRQYSETSMNRGRGGMPPPGGYRGAPYRGGFNGDRSRGGYPDASVRGRGGMPPPGGYRGGYRGGYNGERGRGGYGGPYRGDPTMMRGGRGDAPPGYGAPRGGFDDRGMSPSGGYGPRRPSPPDQPGYDAYANQAPAGQYQPYNPDDSRSSLPRAESPPPLPGMELGLPVGQAVEMDAATGSPQNAPRGFGQFGGLRDSDGDVAGMVGLQQQRLNQRGTLTSDTSQYSAEEPYVPPRQAWNSDQPGRSSPLNPHPSAAELPSQTTGAQTRGHRRTSSGDNYYEDVDPRFASDPVAIQHPSALPTALAPGNYHPANNSLRPGGLDGNASYEDLQSGARSPAESDRSNFTSVSQRGVNPRWNGNGGQQGGYAAAPMPRRPVGNMVPPPSLQQRDVISSNPDFELPGGRGARRGGGGGGRGAYPGDGML